MDRENETKFALNKKERWIGKMRKKKDQMD